VRINGSKVSEQLSDEPPLSASAWDAAKELVNIYSHPEIIRRIRHHWVA
jgi:hypothetical protein